MRIFLGFRKIISLQHIPRTAPYFASYFGKYTKHASTFSQKFPKENVDKTKNLGNLLVALPVEPVCFVLEGSRSNLRNKSEVFKQIKIP